MNAHKNEQVVESPVAKCKDMMELSAEELDAVNGGIAVSGATLIATGVGVALTAATGGAGVGIACVAAGALYSYFSREAY